ncbi:MAG TPA: cellulase family glycosylhydrolase [Chthoniobacteraceae bacterium]|jgi:aryl-phospho-beta-D-glucosidase BglC (GH1 family)|nr:cellulase family glycosylhydrolase [Chthoniobacteraceae bacterium]
MNRRRFLKLGAVAAVGAGLRQPQAAAAPAVLPEPAVSKLPRWRGFNLLEKFTLSENRPFAEQDFAWLAGWGFNFVRLPMDYRCWAKSPDADFDETVLREIDQAVAWGGQYGVHVSMNFHRGPGYCVNPPKEKGDLWTDPTIQKEFARHWGVFAKRYLGTPSRQLSFDLINEPPDIPGAKYAEALKPAVETIANADPERLIIGEGLAWGGKPVDELIPLGIAQSTHSYEPIELTHYRASWIAGSDKFPLPRWPVPAGMNCFLYGPDKADFKSALTLEVECPAPATFSIHIDHVSSHAGLVVKADGVIILQHALTPGPGAGEWVKSVANAYGGYDADYDRDYSASIPAGTREIELGLDQGDWLTFSAIRIGDVTIQPVSRKWGQKQEAFVVNADGAHPVKMRYACSKETLWEEHVNPWRELAAKGIGVHVGEWGVFNRTPHDVAIAWMRDCLDNWRAAGFGWALWNFRGSFGVLDSDREDVNYENFQGHKLDRQMLELLRTG